MNYTVNISLPKDLADLAKREVKKGMYTSVSEVIRTALRKLLIEEEEQLSPRAARRYEKMIRDIDSGKVPVYKATSVKDLMDQLHDHKSPVRTKFP